MTYKINPQRSPNASIRPYLDKWPKLEKDLFLADGARIIGQVTMGKSCSVWFNAVIRGDVNTISIGNGVNVQDGAVIHCSYQTHPTIIGDGVSIGHLAMIHGCQVGSGSLVGMHSVIQDGAQLGEFCLVGAGTLITQNMVVPPKCLVLGRPGRIVRELTPGEIDNITQTGMRYLMYTQGYNFGHGAVEHYECLS